MSSYCPSRVLCPESNTELAGTYELRSYDLFHSGSACFWLDFIITIALGKKPRRPLARKIMILLSRMVRADPTHNYHPFLRSSMAAVYASSSYIIERTSPCLFSALMYDTSIHLTSCLTIRPTFMFPISFH